MLYVFLGEDRVLRERAKERAQKEAAKRGATMVVYTAVQFNPDTLIQHIHATEDLFGEKVVVVVESVCDEGHEDVLVSFAPALKESATPFYILERTVSTAAKKTFGKYADALEEQKKEKAERQMGAFGFAHAFEQKKKAESWVQYQEALLKGEAAEALHGILFWKVKEMYKHPRGRSHKEVAALLGDLSELPVVSRRKGVELSYALEQFILER